MITALLSLRLLGEALEVAAGVMTSVGRRRCLDRRDETRVLALTGRLQLRLASNLDLVSN